MVIYIIVSGIHGHKNIPSANPLFSGIIIAHPILHISTIRVKGGKCMIYTVVVVDHTARVEKLYTGEAETIWNGF